MKTAMKNILAAATVTLGLFGILRADMLTGQSVTDRYIAGELDARLEELGTDKITEEKKPEWKLIQEGGVKIHCARTLVARGSGYNPKCGKAIGRTRLGDMY